MNNDTKDVYDPSAQKFIETLGTTGSDSATNLLVESIQSRFKNVAKAYEAKLASRGGTVFFTSEKFLRHPTKSKKMTDQDVIDLKLKLQESEINTRMARHDEKINNALILMEKNTNRLEQDIKTLNTSISSMKWWMIGTGLSVIIGIASFNATVLSNMVASFDSGRDTASAIERSSIELKNTTDLLSKIRQDLEKEQSKSEKTELAPNPPNPTK